jgi:hypothetical protein
MSNEQPWRWAYAHDEETERFWFAKEDTRADAVADGLDSAESFGDGCGVWVFQARNLPLTYVDLFSAGDDLDWEDPDGLPSAHVVLDLFADAHEDLWDEDGWRGVDAEVEADLQRRIDDAPRTVDGLNAAVRAWFDANFDVLQETVFMGETRALEMVHAPTPEAEDA